MVEQGLGIVGTDAQRRTDVGQRVFHAAALRPQHAQQMAGGEVIARIGQYLQIQAFGLGQSSAAVQRDRLFAGSLVVHWRRWYPFGGLQKQWGPICKLSAAAMPWP